jgi:hypothetical protein
VDARRYLSRKLQTHGVPVATFGLRDPRGDSNQLLATPTQRAVCNNRPPGLPTGDLAAAISLQRASAGKCCKPPEARHRNRPNNNVDPHLQVTFLSFARASRRSGSVDTVAPPSRRNFTQSACFAGVQLLPTRDWLDLKMPSRNFARDSSEAHAFSARQPLP